MIEALTSIINPDALLSKIVKRDNSDFIVIESGAMSDIQKLTIESAPDESFGLTLDLSPFRQLSSYLNIDNKGINKSCDFIIISNTPNKNNSDDKSYNVDIVVGEMKSTKVGPKGSNQIENSILFIDYIISLLNHHNEIKLKPKYFRRIISSKVHKRPIGKKDACDLSIKCPGQIVNKECRIAYRSLISAS